MIRYAFKHRVTGEFFHWGKSIVLLEKKPSPELKFLGMSQADYKVVKMRLEEVE